MVKGTIIRKAERYEVLIPVSEEERTEGMDKHKGPLVYVYCCEKDLVFRGCKEKIIDIAFANKKGSSFRIVKVVHSLPPLETVEGRGYAVIEAEEGWMKRNGFGVGDEFELSVEFLNAKVNAAYLIGRRAQRERGPVRVDDVDYEVAKEIFMLGFRGEELREALRSLGLTDERIDAIEQRLFEEFKEVEEIFNRRFV